METEKPAYLHGLAKPKEDAGISSSVTISPVCTTVPSASTQRLSPWVSVHPQESQTRVVHCHAGIIINTCHFPSNLWSRLGEKGRKEAIVLFKFLYFLSAILGIQK